MKYPSFTLLAALALHFSGLAAPAASEDPPSREIHWLEENGGSTPGTTWGVPWPQGAMAAGAKFQLKTAAGDPVPMQSWPLAFWPDGSLKWTAHAIPASGNLAGPLELQAGAETLPAAPLKVTQDAGLITVDTGVIQCLIPKSGGVLIRSITRQGKTLAADGRLVCRLRSSPDLGAEGEIRQQTFYSEGSSAEVEQAGPVRAVVKIQGKHAAPGGRAWLPFVVRLYFYAGGESARLVHTIIYDGDQNRDFISALGVRFSVPLTDPLYDRHVRFATDADGVWGESVMGLTGLHADPGAAVRAAQIAGLKTPPLASWAPVVAQDYKYIPAFSDFTLAQLSSDAFEIRKSTGPDFTPLASLTGHRAPGLGYLGGPGGGLAFGIRNFWQSFPAQLDIRKAASATAEVTAWLWSPDARPMDLRPFHGEMGMTTFDTQNEGAKMTYEDYEPGFSTPTGIARTSELMLWALPATPSHEQTAALARTLSKPPLLVCQPQDYIRSQVLGGGILWKMPDRSTPVRTAIEDQLDLLMGYYEKQVEQRHWYGFWYYGNVMHRYDFDRHTWRYDIGGFAWDNSEQSTDVWLWESFLRSGRADIFRFAEAMTRNTGEVDVYHLGRFAGLGSRHAVVPWGDSSKQLRVSTAENRRFYFYLTADDRCGDLMREELTADRTAGQVPVERKVSKAMSDLAGKPYPMNFLSGIEWTSMAAAWLTEWERTGDVKWRDRLITGMKGIAALPHAWFSAGGGYDPATGKFFTRDDEYYASPLSASFGGFEVNTELLQVLDVPEYEKAWLQYCRYYNASAEEQQKALGHVFAPLYLTQAHSRLTAYAAWKEKDEALARRAWGEFFGGLGGGMRVLAPLPALQHFAGPVVAEPVDEFDVSTNMAAGFGLSAINCLALAGPEIPAQIPPAPAAASKVTATAAGR